MVLFDYLASDNTKLSGLTFLWQFSQILDFFYEIAFSANTSMDNHTPII